MSKDKQQIISEKIVKWLDISTKIKQQKRQGEPMSTAAGLMYLSEITRIFEEIYDEGFLAGMKVEINTTKN